MKEYFSPLRYPGGKGRLVPFFEQLLIDNALTDGVYVEPYVGGGAVALSLLFKEYVRKVYINDKDRSIFAFWYSVLHDTENLCNMIENTPVTMDTWQHQRNIQLNKHDENLLDLAFSTFFLNRTNRSGIIKAGVIGGNNQKGNYKIDARYNKKDLIQRIERVAAYRDRIELSNIDAIDFVENASRTLPQRSLLYLDPPYFRKGRGLYMNYYNENDHKAICDVVKNVNQHCWVVTYDNSEFIKSLYNEFRSREFLLNYSANNNGQGKEIVFFSDKVCVTSEILSKLNLIE